MNKDITTATNEFLLKRQAYLSDNITIVLEQYNLTKSLRELLEIERELTLREGQ